MKQSMTNISIDEHFKTGGVEGSNGHDVDGAWGGQGIQQGRKG